MDFFEPMVREGYEWINCVNRNRSGHVEAGSFRGLGARVNFLLSTSTDA